MSSTATYEDCAEKASAMSLKDFRAWAKEHLNGQSNKKADILVNLEDACNESSLSEEAFTALSDIKAKPVKDKPVKDVPVKTQETSPKPKKCLSAFFRHNRAMRLKNPDEKLTASALGAMWKQLSDEDKQPYIDEWIAEKEELAQNESDAKASESDPEPDAKASVSDAKASDSDAKASESDDEPEPQPELKPEPQPQPQPEPKPEPKPEPELKSKGNLKKKKKKKNKGEKKGSDSDED